MDYLRTTSVPPAMEEDNLDKSEFHLKQVGLKTKFVKMSRGVI